MLDPPFLSEECQTKCALTARLLLASSSGSSPSGSGKMIVCTGERMESLVTEKLYKPLGVKMTNFEVVHPNGLSNEFRCYANFIFEAWE